jgi:hypothetical protein
MKFTLFHLMPYADLDLVGAAAYPTAWVHTPNTFYDPKRGARLYNRYLDELEYGEELGFDGVCVNEHHQTAYGIMPSPIVTASALARRTKTAKHRDPRQRAPAAHASADDRRGTLDDRQHHRGAADLGFVRGIGAEYHVFGTNPTFSHERFHEAHDLIIRPGPSPARSPGPQQALPLRVRERLAASLPEAASAGLDPVAGQRRDHRLRRAPDHKYTYLQTFSPMKAVREVPRAIPGDRGGFGYDRERRQARLGRADLRRRDRRVARREAKLHFENFRNRFLKMPIEMLLPPGIPRSSR